MGIATTELTPVEQTAFLTEYARALDSQWSRPILGDRLAHEVVGKIDHDFAGLGVQTTAATPVAGIVCTTVEQVQARVDEMSGGPVQSFAFPITLLADLALIPEKLFAAFNVTYALSFTRAGGKWQQENPLELSAALSYAVTRYTAGFPGAIHVEEDTLRRMVVDVCSSLMTRSFLASRDDRVSFDEAEELYLRYQLDAIMYSIGSPRLFVAYEHCLRTHGAELIGEVVVSQAANISAR